MTKNDFLIRGLLNKISDYNGFVLYGAGYISQLLKEKLAEENIKPLYCVVTGKDGNPEKSGETNVYSFQEKKSELCSKRILIVIAVSYPYEREIRNLLNQEGIVNYISVSEYCCDFAMFKELYIEKDLKWYLSRIKKWQYEHYETVLDDSCLLESREENPAEIVLVVNHPSPRALKIIKALMERGEKITVLVDKKTVKEPVYSLWCEDLEKLGICYYYNWIEELFFLLLKKRKAVIHVFSTWGNICITYILLKLQNENHKVIVDEYDIVNGYYTEVDENTLRLEKYCLEHASGICYRDFSLEYLTDYLDFNVRGKTIRFFDYCFGKDSHGALEENKGELSLCYAGGVVTEEDYVDCPFAFSMEFIETCEKNRCHLHIYPTCWDEVRYGKLIKKAEGSNYFHFHKPVMYEGLFQELSQYDYGIILTRDDIWEKEVSGYNTKYKYIYAATNKLFDYLDAGLPIISAEPKKMAEYLEDMGVLINWTNGQFDFNHLMAVRKSMRQKTAKIREELWVGNHIGKLVDFYESL